MMQPFHSVPVWVINSSYELIILTSWFSVSNRYTLNVALACCALKLIEIAWLVVIHIVLSLVAEPVCCLQRRGKKNTKKTRVISGKCYAVEGG